MTVTLIETTDTPENVLDAAEPMRSARALVEKEFKTSGLRTLHRYRGTFWIWTGSHYRLLKDEDVRARIAELIGPAAPPGPAGTAWAPDLAVNGDGCLEVVNWIEWPADAGPPPRGVLGENGIINPEFKSRRYLERIVSQVVAATTPEADAQSYVKQIVPGVFETMIREGQYDEAEARRILEDHRDLITKAIMAKVLPT